MHHWNTLILLSPNFDNPISEIRFRSLFFITYSTFTLIIVDNSQTISPVFYFWPSKNRRGTLFFVAVSLQSHFMLINNLTQYKSKIFSHSISFSLMKLERMQAWRDKPCMHAMGGRVAGCGVDVSTPDWQFELRWFNQTWIIKFWFGNFSRIFHPVCADVTWMTGYFAEIDHVCICNAYKQWFMNRNP